MIVEFEHRGETLIADVTSRGLDDRDPRRSAFDCDELITVKWIDDGGFEEDRELDNAAVEAFRDARWVQS